MLLERGTLRRGEVDRALEEQSRDGRRLCSILISRGALEFDEGARILADQRGVPCALAKHLGSRDVALAGAITPELGRSACALPIGRTSGGMLIVAVRDPDPALHAALRRATDEEVMMVVTPATRLEHLIAAQYGAGNDDFEVELDSAVDLEVHRPKAEPPPPDVDLLDPDSVRLALSDLDDSRVSKDPTQSGMFVLPSGRSAGSTLPPPVSLVQTRHALEAAPTREAATSVAMAFLAGRWQSAVIFAVRATTALGYRAHNALVAGEIARVAIALSLPSTIQRAVSSKQPSTMVPEGAAQDQLSRLLGAPSTLTAAPVLVAQQVVAVIATGDPQRGAGDRSAATDLAELAESLGAAYERTRKRA
ncbi:MAG TPA: hypothetical protein VH143_10185 [Kofleriaceae bacterium]|jgi:hypothetical protein|nr:hypothetical protein [Kofleriaceae bacterium]